jgi:DNA polymerase
VSKYLYPDLETFAVPDIKRVSMDAYAYHPDTRILMCAFSFDSGPAEIWQEGDTGLAGLMKDFKSHIVIPWNTNFERTLTKAVWGLDGVHWRDAMVLALYAGLPAGLKDCNRVPFFQHEAETKKESLLINKFCKPGKEVRNRETDPEDWQLFCDYCKADVHDTRLIWQWLEERFPNTDALWNQWEIDQRINQRGMPIDRVLTERAWAEGQRLTLREQDRLKTLTGLDNPNSNAQLLAWLRDRGYPYDGLGKELVKKALKEEPDGEADIDD